MPTVTPTDATAVPLVATRPIPDRSGDGENKIPQREPKNQLDVQDDPNEVKLRHR